MSGDIDGGQGRARSRFRLVRLTVGHIETLFFFFPLNEIYRDLCGVIISKKWKEAYTTEVMPEIGFLKKWKRNIPSRSESWRHGLQMCPAFPASHPIERVLISSVIA